MYVAVSVFCRSMLSPAGMDSTVEKLGEEAGAITMSFTPLIRLFDHKDSLSIGSKALLVFEAETHRTSTNAPP